MGNWSEIPEDIIDAILNRMSCVEDFVRSGAVCRSWRSVTITLKESRPRSFNPWLLLPPKENEKDKAYRVCFSTCSQQKFRLELPEAVGRRCLGSSSGWLMTLGLDLNINLLNPLSRAQISLPSHPSLNVRKTGMRTLKMSIERFAVSSTASSSSNQELVVMVLYGGVSLLSFASPGDQSWTSMQTQLGGFGDVIYFEGEFYATGWGKLYLCEIYAPKPKVTQLASPLDTVEATDNCYLVEISGHLHLVVRSFKRICRGSDVHYATSRFEVYRFDFHSREWTHVPDNIGNYAMFVGTNATFSISTSDYPELNSNSIYFTCDDQEECFGPQFCDMGVYDYQNKTNKPLYSGDDVFSTFCTPLLFMPAL